MPEARYIHGTEPAEQERLAQLNRMTNAPFVAFLDLRADEAVLEVGSGLGILAADVAAHVPRGSVVGLESSPEQLSRAARGPANLSFVQGDAHRLPWPDSTFDLVYCRYVLEHLADPERALREMHLVTRPGGRLRVQENDTSLVRFDPDCPAFDLVWARFADLQAALGGDAHIGRRLNRLIRAAGWGPVELSLQPEVHTAGSPTFAPWVENLIGNIHSAEAELIARGLATLGQIRSAIDELRGLLEHPRASAGFAWNRAAADK